MVIDKSAELFDSDSYASVSMDDIAAAVGVAKPTLYHYFKSKDEILLEVQQAAIAQMTAVELNPQSSSLNGRELFEAFVNRYVTMIVDDFGTCLIKTGDLPLEPDNRKAIRKGSKGIELTMRAILERGAKDKSLAPCDAKLEAMFLFGTLNWIPYWYRPDGELSVEGLAEKVTRSLLARLTLI
jgi:AcrR family transcriptional regulator